MAATKSALPPMLTSNDADGRRYTLPLAAAAAAACATAMPALDLDSAHEGVQQAAHKALSAGGQREAWQGKDRRVADKGG